MLASGSALSSWTVSKIPDTWAWDLGNKVDGNLPVTKNENNNKALLDCLRSMWINTIIDNDITGNYSTLLVWKPDIEGDFIPDDPITMLKDEEYLIKIGFFDIDLFVDANNNEGSLFEFFLSGTREPDYVKNNHFRPTIDSMYKTHNDAALNTLTYEYTLQTDQDQTTVDEEEIANAL